MRLFRNLCRQALVSAVCLCGPFQVEAQVGVWAPIGPANATVISMQQDPFSSSTYYAGVYFGGIFKSTDSGKTWSNLPSPFTSDVVFTIDCDPSHQGTLYAGTFQNGLFKSTNGGQTWSNIDGTIQSLDDEAFGIDPANSNILIVGSGGNGYRSTDAGATWKQMTQNVRTVFFDPFQSGVVYVGTYSNGLLKSTDGGVTFTSFTTGIGTNTVLSIHESSDGKSLYAAALQGIFELDSGQTTWTNITGTLAWNGSGDILSVPGSPNILLAGTSLGVYTENKNAATPAWTRVNTIGTRFLYAPAAGELWAASVFGGLYTATTAAGPFTLSVNGIQNYFVEALGAFATGTTTQVFAGTDHGVFTEPAGGSWVASAGLSQTIFSLAQSPAAAKTIYAGTQSAGVWSTPDGGTTWSSLASGMVPHRVSAVAEFVDVKPVVLAGTTNGVFQSLDSGQTWNETLLQGGVLSMATDPSTQANAYVGGAAGQIMHTTNYGASFSAVDTSTLPASNVVGLTVIPYAALYAILGNGQAWALFSGATTWTQVNANVTAPITCVAGDPSDVKTEYMGTSGGGVYKSGNFGQTWTQVDSGLTAPYVYALAVDPANSNNLYAATNSGVYKSTDKASTWTLAATGLPADPVVGIVIGSKGSVNLVASVLNQGVYYTTNAGSTWQPAAAGPPAAGSTALAISPLYPGTFYGGTTDGGIYISTDSGAHWQTSNSGLSVFVRKVLVDPANSSLMFAATLSDGVFGSTNAGSTWKNLGLTDRTLFGLALDPAAPQTIYAAGSLGVSKSTNGGATWEDLGQHNPYLYSMVVDPSNPSTIYIGGSGGSLFKSVDGGQTWSEALSGIPLGDVYHMAVNSSTGTLYADVDLVDLVRSSDGGATWTACTAVAALTRANTTGLAVDPSSGVIYLATDSAGLFKSADNCKTWTSAKPAIFDQGITALLASQKQASLLIAGTTTGLYRSTDGGTTWVKIASGLEGAGISSVAEDLATAGTIYAGTNQGVFRSIDYGVTWHTLVTAGIPLDLGVTSILGDGARNNLYAVAGSHGLCVLTPGRNAWRAVPTTAGSATIQALAFGSSNETLYAATGGSGFLSSTTAGNTWSAAITLNNVQTVTNVVLVDPSQPQTIYAATGGTGVQKSLDGGMSWQPANTGLTRLYVVAMIMDPTDPSVLYVGTAQGGVFMSRNAGATWTPLLAGLYDLNVVSLALDGNNHNILYAGTEGAGVFRIQVQ